MPSGFVGGVVERGVVWGGRKPDVLDQIQWRATTMAWGSQHRMFEGKVGELGLLSLAREGSKGMPSLSTASGYREDRARLFSGVHSKRTRGNGHNLQQLDIWRTLLHKSGQTLEPVPRKLMGSPVLEIFKTQLDKAMSNLVLTLNLALFEEGELRSDNLQKVPFSLHNSMTA